MKRIALVICLAAVLLLAMAAPVFAQPDGTSGTVYGKAILAPYAITISGGGTDPGSPLTYEGALNAIVPEQFGNRVTVQNSGSQNAQITIIADQEPIADNGMWALGGGNAGNVATWEFYGPAGSSAVVPDPEEYPSYMPEGTLVSNLGSGSSAMFDTWFQFPTDSTSTGDHYMSATISAVAPY
jgi:hypothetical protein